MGTISEYLHDDHRRCDKLCSEVEASVSSELWDRAEKLFKEFRSALERHFDMEENVLFVAFEKAIRSTEGPTSVMRDEHQKIRSVIFMLQDALARRSRNAFLGHSDTLNIMIQQHNQVEESILHPMFDQLLGARKHELIDAMNRITVSKCDPNED